MQQKSATKFPMGTWRRNFHPTSLRDRRFAHINVSAAVIFLRRLRALPRERCFRLLRKFSSMCSVFAPSPFEGRGQGEGCLEGNCFSRRSPLGNPSPQHRSRCLGKCAEGSPVGVLLPLQCLWIFEVEGACGIGGMVLVEHRRFPPRSSIESLDRTPSTGLTSPGMVPPPAPSPLQGRGQGEGSPLALALLHAQHRLRCHRHVRKDGKY